VNTKRIRVIVSVSNDLTTDQRVHKICSFIENQGYDVLLLGRKFNNSLVLNRSYSCKRFRLWFKKGALFYANLNLRLFFYLLFHKAHVLVANDLDTLLPNYIVSKLKKVTLVYDSHEYFTEVPELIHRPNIQKIWLRIEEKIFPNLKFVSTVNSSIQRKYETKYKVPVLVVRNVSPKWIPNQTKSKSELGIPENKFILIFQGAGINVHRGAEEITLAMKDLPNCCLLFVGDGDVISNIKHIVSTNNLDNVLFFKKRPYNELLNFTFHADLGLSLDKPNNPNYELSLPNKIFDYIQTNTPILASNIKHVKEIVEKYEIGFITTSHNPKELARIINDIIHNQELQNKWKDNCKKAAQIECWENEVIKLNKFYPKIS
jgi:glycosyltransferase involved in cell wall biosynthesis